MSNPTVTYQSLHDYSALPVLRESIAAGATGLTITGLDTFNIDVGSLLQEAETSKKEAFRCSDKHLEFEGSNVDTQLVAPMRALHALATTLLNNLSHVLELPWEKYLAELHEFLAPGGDEICLSQKESAAGNAWSTFAFVIDQSKPSVCRVAYGEALWVLSEGQVSAAKSLPLDSDEGRAMIYYVRPNDSTYYTRAAGALMTPLSDEEYKNRQTVKELGLPHIGAISK